MKLKRFLKAFSSARRALDGEYKQLWDDPAYKYTVHQLVEDLKNEWMFAKTPEEREQAHQQFQALQRVTFKMQHLYNNPEQKPNH